MLQRFMFLLLAVGMLAGCASDPTPAEVADPTEAPMAATEAPVDEPPSDAMATEAPADMGAEVMLPDVDPTAYSGEVISAGSSTVFPLAERMALRFEDEGFDGNVSIDMIGSGAGFERFCVAGETHVANASRRINESEIASCQSIGRDPIEFRVGTDALVVAVSQENDFVESVTMEELTQLFGPAANWSDINPEWPAEPIQRFIPGTDSGTFDYFVEEVYDEDNSIILSAANTQKSEDDNVLVQGIEGSPYAVGFFGYAYYAENDERLRAISVEGVPPSQQSVDEATYPLARPLYLYSDAAIMTENPHVAAYLNFFLTFVNEEILDVGYFPASDEALNEARQKWLDAVGGAL